MSIDSPVCLHLDPRRHLKIEGDPSYRAATMLICDRITKGSDVTQNPRYRPFPRKCILLLCRRDPMERKRLRKFGESIETRQAETGDNHDPDYSSRALIMGQHP